MTEKARIVEYIIIKDGEEELNIKVNDYLNKGWELYGEPKTAGMAATTIAWDWIIQALVRRDGQ